MMNKKQTERNNNLLPDGKPRYIRCYDNQGESFDRYTVVYTGRYADRQYGIWEYVAMSSNPFHPQGFGQHGELEQRDGAWLGKRIDFDQLPLDCQKLVLNDYKQLWNLDYKTVWELLV